MDFPKEKKDELATCFACLALYDGEVSCWWRIGLQLVTSVLTSTPWIFFTTFHGIPHMHLNVPYRTCIIFLEGKSKKKNNEAQTTRNDIDLATLLHTPFKQITLQEEHEWKIKCLEIAETWWNGNGMRAFRYDWLQYNSFKQLLH